MRLSQHLDRRVGVVSTVQEMASDPLPSPPHRESPPHDHDLVSSHVGRCKRRMGHPNCPRGHREGKAPGIGNVLHTSHRRSI
jgi:hypothetical protein